jgi:hypothetical protein
MDVVEVNHNNALVVVVGGSRPNVTPVQVTSYLAQFFQVEEQEVRVVWSYPDGFLLVF